MNRATALIYYIIIAIISLTVCITATITPQEQEINPPPQEVSWFIENGLSDYTIIYGAAEDEWASHAAQSLSDGIYEMTGVKLPVIPDTNPAPESGAEILIGQTNRGGDYFEGLYSIGSNGYAIFISGPRIVINVYSAAGAKSAVSCFLGDYVSGFADNSLALNPSMSYVFTSYKGDEPDRDLLAASCRLEFGADGRFRVLIVSDIYMGAGTNEYTLTALETLVSGENPDLVLLCGNIITDAATKTDLHARLEELVRPMESRGIAWAHVFGETDAACEMSLIDQMEVYTSFEYCVSKAGGGGISGVSNYLLPVYGYGSDIPVFGVWGLGGTGKISSAASVYAAETITAETVAGGADFGFIRPNQVQWYYSNSAALEKYLGRKLPSIIYLHIPPPEFELISQYPVESMKLGISDEPLRTSPLNSGLFSSILLRGDICGIYAGNNHLNSFSGKLFGMEMALSGNLGYDGYGYGGSFETNNQLRGGRIIEINEDNPWSPTSREVLAKIVRK